MLFSFLNHEVAKYWTKFSSERW